MNLARAVRISGDGGQEGRHLAKKNGAGCRGWQDGREEELHEHRLAHRVLRRDLQLDGLPHDTDEGVPEQRVDAMSRLRSMLMVLTINAQPCGYPQNHYCQDY